MTARDKLNLAHVQGALLIAGGAGLLTGSWALGLLVWVALIAAAYAANDLRLPPGPPRRGRN